MAESVSKSMPAGIRYSERFQDANAALAYDAKEYGAGSYSACIWSLQRPVVQDLVRQFSAARKRPITLLDFACGTGRVISCLEGLVDSAEGIDISPQMVDLARAKCSNSRLLVGNILENPGSLRGNYDLITAFRFLLNVEPEIRRKALRRLREMIQEPDGMLLVNVHGNACSLRHPAIVWRRWRQRSKPGSEMLNEMSLAAAESLLHQCGFKVMRKFGFGILPPTLYRTPLRPAALAIDKMMAGDRWCRGWSIDVLFVCRPI